MTFYVSPTGNDQNPGTLQLPFATLSTAVQSSRLTKAPKEIVLFGGEYDNTYVTLNSQDSGLTIRAAENSTPLLRGGIKIHGWQNVGDNLYCTDLPDEAPDTIRLLEINGQYKSRSRFPRTGYIEHVSDFSSNWTSTLGGGWDAQPNEEQLTHLTYNPDFLPDNFDWKDTELTVFHRWDVSLVSVTQCEPDAHRLTLSPACGHPPGSFSDSEGKKYIIWNTEAGMEPGCWRIDKSARKLYYRTLPGEKMEEAEAYLPLHNSILHLNEISNLTIHGLSFGITNAPSVAGGFGAEESTGAIAGEGTLKDCYFSNLEFRNVGGWGICTKGHNLNVTVCNCSITDAGAGGIYMSGGDNCLLKSNFVKDVGKIHFSAVGIYTSEITHCEVTENTVINIPYSGIDHCSGADSRVTRNHVINAMYALNDGAGIYVALCPRGLLQGNLVENIPQGTDCISSRNGLYLDEPSSEWIVEGNITIDCTHAMMNHMSHGNIIRNNIFTTHSDDMLFSIIRSDHYCIEENTFHTSGKLIFEGREGSVDIFRNNHLYSAEDSIEEMIVHDDYVRETPRTFSPEKYFQNNKHPKPKLMRGVN